MAMISLNKILHHLLELLPVQYSRRHKFHLLPDSLVYHLTPITSASVVVLNSPVAFGGIDTETVVGILFLRTLTVAATVDVFAITSRKPALGGAGGG